MKIHRKYKNYVKVYGPPNNHCCCWCTAVVAPMLEPARPCQRQPGSLRARASKNLHPGATVVVVESLNRIEEPGTKYCWGTMRNSNPTASRSCQECTPELRLIRPNGQTWGGLKPERLSWRRSVAIRPNAAPARAKILPICKVPDSRHQKILSPQRRA